MRKKPEYNIWGAMKQRCYNPNNKAYQDYGGRGITVCDRWKNSFKNFLDDMGPRPSKDHSIDRIDVNGNYCKENCRWADRTIQARNQRIRKTSISGCTGVTWDNIKKNWHVRICVNYKTINIGRFKELNDAIKARKEAEIKYF